MNKRILTAALATTILLSGGTQSFASEINVNQNVETIQAQLNDLIRLAEPIAEGNTAQEETIAKIKSQMDSLSTQDFIKEVPNMERKLKAIIYEDNGAEEVNKKELEEAYEDGIYAYENNIIGEKGSKEELLRALKEAETLLDSPNVSRKQIVQISESIRYNIGVEINEDSADLSELRTAIKKIEEINNEDNKKLINSAKSLLLSNPNQEDVNNKTKELNEVIRAYQKENISDTKNKTIDTIENLNLSDEEKSTYIENVKNSDDVDKINEILEEAKTNAKKWDLEEFKEMINNLKYLSDEQKQQFITEFENSDDTSNIEQEAIDLNYENLKSLKDDLLSNFKKYKHIKSENIENIKQEVYNAQTLEDAENILNDYEDKLDKIEEAVIEVENLSNLTDEQMDYFNDKLNNFEDIQAVLKEANDLNETQDLVERYSKDDVISLRQQLSDKLNDDRVNTELREKSEEALTLADEVLASESSTLREYDEVGKALYEQYTEVQNYLLDLDTNNKPIDNTQEEKEPEIEILSDDQPVEENGKTEVVNITTDNNVNKAPVNVVEKQQNNVVNKENLNKAITKGNEFIKEGKGTKEQNDRLIEALIKARNIYHDSKATQQQVDDMEKELLSIMGLTHDEIKSDVRTGVESVLGVAGLLSIAAMAYLTNKKK